MSNLQNIYSEMDEYALKTFCLNSTKEQYSKLNPSKTFSGYINNHPEVKNLVENYLYHRFDDLDGTETVAEILARIKHHIEKRPTCKVCGRKLSFIASK